MHAYVFLDGAKESRSFDPLRETKIGLKTRVVRGIRSKITVFD